MAKKNMEIKFSSNYNWHMAKYHFHQTYEVIILLSDGGSFFVNNTIYPIKRGSLFVFNSMDLHRSSGTPDSAYNFCTVHFYPDFISDIVSDTNIDLMACYHNREKDFNHSILLDNQQLNKFLDLVNKGYYYNNLSENNYGKEIYEKISLIEILLFVNNLFRNSPLDSSLDIQHSSEFSKILPIINYIQKNLTEELTLDDLSNQFFINKFYLSHLFKETTGFTIKEFIISNRIIEARQLLKKNNTVQQVGEMVGFNNNSHFIRTFKKMVGMSPKQYAQKYFS